MANESKYIEPSEEPTIDTEKLFKGHETQILKAREKLLEIKTWVYNKQAIDYLDSAIAELDNSQEDPSCMLNVDLFLNKATKLKIHPDEWNWFSYFIDCIGEVLKLLDLPIKLATFQRCSNHVEALKHALNGTSDKFLVVDLNVDLSRQEFRKKIISEYIADLVKNGLVVLEDDAADGTGIY